MKVAEARRLGLLSLGKQSKYNNQKTLYKGFLYDSKREAMRAMELDSLKKRKVIREWNPQHELKIIYEGQKICSYFADFRVEYHNGVVEFEDVKGVRTAVFILKKKLVRAFYGITIKEL